MDALNARLDEVMRALAEERTHRIATEEALRQTQARLDATASQQNPAPPQQAPALPPPPATTNTSSTIVLAKPKSFDGTRGAPAEAFVAQIGLHTITYPERFPTDASKVAFTVSFMTDYASTWAQPYLTKIFESQEVVFSEFINDFKASFYDHNRRHRAEVALRNLRQNGTVSAYTQDFNMHARTIGWDDAPLMSLYQNGLKENIQLAVVMSNIQFSSLQEMQAMALKAGQTIEGIRTGRPAPIPPSSAPAPDPNAMDLSAFQRTPGNRLSEAERARRAQLNLCFRCGQAGHVARGCANGGRKPQGRQQTSSSARISELQAEINRIRASTSTSSPNPNPTPENASSSKNGGAQV